MRPAMSFASSGSRSRKVPQFINNDAYEIVSMLGAGCFGEVHRAIERVTNQEVAVKFEEELSGTGATAGQLAVEAKFLKELSQDQPQGFAKYFWEGQVRNDEGVWNCLVMEFLGMNLEDCKQKCGTDAATRKMNEQSVVLLADQMLRRIEYLHSKGIVHRDIKPENFCFGVGHKAHHLYLIDFGLSKMYWEKNWHCSLKSKKTLTGTARYASLNNHRGMEHGRRDDLEAIGHMMFYFLKGALPWSGLDAKTKQEKYRRIREKKGEHQNKRFVPGLLGRVREIPDILPKLGIRGPSRLLGVAKVVCLDSAKIAEEVGQSHPGSEL